MKLVLRLVLAVPRPEYAVVRLRGYAGTDIAWFFHRKDAEEYMKWKQKRKVKQ